MHFCKGISSPLNLETSIETLNFGQVFHVSLLCGVSGVKAHYSSHLVPGISTKLLEDGNFLELDKPTDT